MLPASPLSCSPGGGSPASAVCSPSAAEGSPCSAGGWLELEGGWLELEGGWLEGGWLEGGWLDGGCGGVLALGQPLNAAAARQTQANFPHRLTVKWPL